MSSSYKFESFKNRRFPVYASTQKGPGTLVAPHFHNAAELVCITDGQVLVHLNTRQFHCQQGDFLYIPPFCTHSITSSCADARLRGIVFDFTLIPPDTAGTDPQKQLNKDKVTQFVIPPQAPVHSLLEDCFSQAFALYSSETITYEFEMLSRLYQLTALLLQHYRTSEEADHRFHRLQPVLAYIQRNYPQSIAISDLSALLHVCDDHLIRLFKDTVGKTPASYILDIRLEEAMKLLVGSDLSVTEISSRCGFVSSCYMARVFKSRLHLTPLQYRRKR